MRRWLEEKRLVLDTAQRMLAAGLVTGTAGNVSLRLAPEGDRPLLAITPTSRPYDSLAPDDIQILDFAGRKVDGDLPPSIEAPMHLGIYRARPDINAVIHTHSVFATTAAVAGLSIPPILDEQVVYLGGEVKLAAYAPGGTPQLAESAVAALGDRRAVLLANHGAVSAGRDLPEAFHAAELLEKTARIYLLALAAGSVTTLTPEAQAAARLLYDKSRHV
jgi:ribulose-5-phosphate 4-epimerase/fuculose-1-phosphate aldolase